MANGLAGVAWLMLPAEPNNELPVVAGAPGVVPEVGAFEPNIVDVLLLPPKRPLAGAGLAVVAAPGVEAPVAPPKRPLELVLLAPPKRLPPPLPPAAPAPNNPPPDEGVLAALLLPPNRDFDVPPLLLEPRLPKSPPPDWPPVAALEGVDEVAPPKMDEGAVVEEAPGADVDGLKLKAMVTIRLGEVLGIEMCGEFTGLRHRSPEDDCRQEKSRWTATKCLKVYLGRKLAIAASTKQKKQTNKPGVAHHRNINELDK